MLELFNKNTNEKEHAKGGIVSKIIEWLNLPAH